MWRAHDEFKESEHPRGQPGNAGQFGSGGGAKKTETKTAKPAAREAQYKAIDDLAGTLKQFGALQSQYASHGMVAPQSFVLKHGFPYVANAKTYAGKRGKPKQCYKNAMLDVLNHPDRSYVEGYITVHGVPIQHAWTVDEAGQIYDPTLNSGEAVGGYYGVPFNGDYALKSALKNKVYGLLGYESRKTMEPLLKGEVKAKEFRAKQDIDKLSPEYIKDRIAYARRAGKAVPHTDKIDTPERHALRKQITDKLYNKDIDKRKHERKATIILGLPASGKSTLAAPEIEKLGALEVDPDLAKLELPEYANGVGTMAVHEESSGIAKNVLAQALKNGDNIVWPRVDSPEKMVNSIKDLKKLGYTVHVQVLDVPTEVAQRSAIQRYLDTGRFVDPDMIADLGDSVMESYKTSKAIADSAEHYVRDASTPNGVKKVDE